MNNFDMTILTPQGDDIVRLVPAADKVMIETSQSRPGSYKNITIELTNEGLEQLRAWTDCYFKEQKENKERQKLISNRKAAYEVYIENLADPDTSNSNVPKNSIDYFNDLKNYLNFLVLAPQLYTSYRHTVIMEFLKASEKTTHKLTMEFLMSGDSVHTILYTVEGYNEHSGYYEFEDEGLTIVPIGSIGLKEDVNLRLCAKTIENIYNEFMETDYE